MDKRKIQSTSPTAKLNSPKALCTTFFACWLVTHRYTYEQLMNLLHSRLICMQALMEFMKFWSKYYYHLWIPESILSSSTCLNQTFTLAYLMMAACITIKGPWFETTVTPSDDQFISHSLWQWLSIWYGCIRHYDSTSVFSMRCCYYKSSKVALK